MGDQSVLPQSLHFTMICCLGVTQNSSKVPNAWSTLAAVMWQGHIHMPIHNIQGGVTDLALHRRNYLPSPVTGPEGRSLVRVCY